MGGAKSLSEKIKEHPVVVITTFVGAAIVGLASFAESLGKITAKAKCIPIYLGFDDGYKGKGTLRYSTQQRDWVNIGVVRKTQPTGNHHCSHDCQGEPTRTNYQVSLSVNDFHSPNLGDRKLDHPKLECKSGPCNGWNHVLNVGITDEGKSATASFDVWSKPTSWELTASILEYQIISEKVVENDLSFSSLAPIEVVVPFNAVSVSYTGSMNDGKPFSIKPSDKSSDDLFVFKSSTGRDGKIEYTYLVNDSRCD